MRFAFDKSPICVLQLSCFYVGFDIMMLIFKDFLIVEEKTFFYSLDFPVYTSTLLPLPTVSTTVPMTVVTTTTIAPTAVVDSSDLNSDNPPPASRIFFPETWLWNLVNL